MHPAGCRMRRASGPCSPNEPRLPARVFGATIGSETMSMPFLEVADLKTHFPLEESVLFRRQLGTIKAVDGVSFTLARGEALGLVGESGCGKSTLGRTILQL